MAIAGTADESQLVIVANSTQTAATPVVQVQSWDGVEVLGVYAGGYGVSAGGVKAVAPTAQPTNVPGLVVNNASSRANSLEVRVASTPQFTIGPSGYAKVPIDLPHIGLPAVETTAITYTVAAGGTGNVWTCPGKCLVHSVLANVTTNFDTTGDDTTLTIGDATDGDGYLTLADAELQAADTEGTGFAAGWQGTSASTLGAYLDLNHNSFPVVGTSAVPYTMTYTLDETSGETLTAGAATFYVTYTRLD
jgi:hypothetical protein